MLATVIIPTYNERENITELIRDILAVQVPCRLSLLVIDDASPDGTGTLVDELAQRLPSVQCIHRQSKKGLGSAYRHAFRLALERGTDLIIQMDADFSHNPRYLPEMIFGANTAEVIIGSRNIPGGGQRGWSVLRWTLSRTANAFARFVLGLKTHDATAGFRCYRREVFDHINVEHVRSDGYSFQVEMTYLCERAGLRVHEIPILFENRIRGSSKISRNEIFQGILTLIRLGLHRFGLIRDRVETKRA